MTEPAAAWRSTGLHWESQAPVLTAAQADPAWFGARQGEHRRTIGVGSRIAWRLRGPRRCVGVWAGTHRIRCPGAAVLADGTDAQCPGCAAASPGRSVARDTSLGDDGRTYVLYGAWFGPGLVKAGLTAADRGRDRLLEQGAIAWTPLASGPYISIRRAERMISAAGLAPERLGPRAVADAWWSLPPAGERARVLAAAYDAIGAHIAGVTGVGVMRCRVTDQAAEFGLAQPPPVSYEEVTGVGDDAELAGEIRCIIGRRLLLSTASGPVLIDMRRGAGWVITGTAAAAPSGVKTVTRTRPGDGHDDHSTLF